MKFKIGDRVCSIFKGVAKIGEVVLVDSTKRYWITNCNIPFHEDTLYYVEDCTGTVGKTQLAKSNTSNRAEESYDKTCITKPTGGPSSYYDFNPNWETLNDLMDEKAEKQWKEHTHYLHNIMKAAFRWGSKDGTTRGYDARKIIYYAFRILRSLEGREAVQKELKSLQEDTQFKV